MGTLNISQLYTKQAAKSQRRQGRQFYRMLLQKETGTYQCGKMGFHVSVFPLNFPIEVDIKGGKSGMF